MKKRLRRFLQLLKDRDKGTVAITFLLSLPIFLAVIGVITQYALLVNGKITVDRAADSAARSAMTALCADPTIENMDGVDFMNKSARMTLAPISPEAKSGTSSEASTIYSALTNLNAPVVTTYANRYTYAQAATSVTYDIVDSNDQVTPVSYNGEVTSSPPPDYFSAHRGVRVKVTISYEYNMTVPLVKNFGGHSGNIAGINGRFTTLSASAIVQLSPGRKAAANSSTGWAN